MVGLAPLLEGTTARAQGWITVVVPEPPHPWREMWGGADVTPHSWSVYSGMTLSPFGAIDANGWRVRVVAGYGAYGYDGSRQIAGELERQAFRGTVSFADLLLGYQKRYGSLTLKAFAGGAAENHQVTPFDAENGAGNLDLGFKGMVEAWLNMTERSWTSLDLSWSSVHDAYSSHLRLGYAIWPNLSLGLEGGAVGNAEYGGGRGGAFARYTWSSGEISVSAGPSLDRSMTTGVYGTLNALTRF
jgi:hypothetical protein